MTIDVNMKRRIEEFVREFGEEFGELPESDEPLITQIEDWSIAIGDAWDDGTKVGIAAHGQRWELSGLRPAEAPQGASAADTANPSRRSAAVACVRAWRWTAGGFKFAIARYRKKNDATIVPRKGRFWRESKVGCLLSMRSETHAEDPWPDEISPRIVASIAIGPS